MLWLINGIKLRLWHENYTSNKLFRGKELRDKDDWVEANRNRDYWGTKDYSPDMNFSHCKQSEPTDEHGTPKEIANAIFFYDVHLHEAHFYHAVDMMVTIQKGMSDEEFLKSGVGKPDDQHGMRKPGTPQDIANKVHHSLDWLRATQKRKWDTRGMNPMRQMLDYAIKGQIVNEYNELHYDERAER